MLIDWFTVIAQVFNFLILVWLLKRFLYLPILDAIDAREKRIAEVLADADAKKAEARNERDEFHHKNEEFDKQRAALLSQATAEAKAERQRLLDVARQDCESLRQLRQEAMRSEQQGLSEALKQRTKEEVFAIARKVLADLAGATLEAAMAEVFMKRLRELDAQELAGLKAAFMAASGPLLVRTAFALPQPQCSAIETAIRDVLDSGKPVQFEVVPELVSGIELSADGQKVTWSIAGYLATLGKGVDALLKTQQPDIHPKQNAHGH